MQGGMRASDGDERAFHVRIFYQEARNDTDTTQRVARTQVQSESAGLYTCRIFYQEARNDTDTTQKVARTQVQSEGAGLYDETLQEVKRAGSLLRPLRWARQSRTGAASHGESP